MIGMATKEYIRKMHFVEGASIRWIAKQTGHSRQYIRKVISEEVPTIPKYKLTKKKEKPVMGPYLDIISSWLQEDGNRPKKQRHTAARIYERLCEEYGFSGSESTVRRCVREIKKQLGCDKRELFIPLEFELGSHAQVDWGEAEVILQGKSQKVYLFVMKLSGSRDSFMTTFSSARQEAFFEGHKQAFEYFGGIPKTIVYDNLKTAVARVLQGKDRKEQDAFMAFKAHYLFEAEFCNVGRGNEKGQVENEVGYLRRNILVPVPEVASLEELNQLILMKLSKFRQTRIVPHTKKTIAEVFQEEKQLLLPLPRYPFDCCVMVPAKSSKESTVRFDNNRYSVPSRYARCRVYIKGYVNEVNIFYEDQLIAIHPRCYERGQDILDLSHYLDVLEHKPYALNHAKAFKEAGLPEIYHQYLAILRQKNDKANLEFVKILKLRVKHGPEVIDEILQMAMDCSVYHYDGIKALFDSFAVAEYSPCSMSGERVKDIPEFSVKPPNLSCFDQLLKGGAA